MSKVLTMKLSLPALTRLTRAIKLLSMRHRLDMSKVEVRDAGDRIITCPHLQFPSFPLPPPLVL